MCLAAVVQRIKYGALVESGLAISGKFVPNPALYSLWHQVAPFSPFFHLPVDKFSSRTQYGDFTQTGGLGSRYGDISLSLPRCFRGPMTIHTSHDRVAFSPAVEERMALLSDVDGVRVYFVGDRPRSGTWRGGNDAGEGAEDADAGGSAEEPLDELSVDGWHSSVRIRWDGEPELRYMNQDGWVSFCMGTARFFTTGRVD